MDVKETLSNELDAAQSELAQAEILLLEAKADAESLREKTARLKAAVAALNGESPPTAAPSDRVKEQPVSETATGTPDGTPHDPRDDMTPEEFDADRKRRQRAKEKAQKENNPLAHLKCTGCGQGGHMVEAFLASPSGVPVRMLVCGKCGNQVL